MKKLILILSLAILSLPSLASAAPTSLSGEKVMISNPINDDAYAIGGLIDINQNIKGDLYIFGADLMISGDIFEDLGAVGGRINLSGDIRGDARIAGASIAIDSQINDDLLAGADIITVSKDTNIGGDTKIAANEIIFKGNVKGDLNIIGENIYLDSIVQGNVAIIAKRLELGPGSSILGDLSYSAESEALIPESVISGEVSFQQIQPDDWRTRGIVTTAKLELAGLLLMILASIVLALALIFYAPHSIEKLNSRARKHTLMSIEIGLLTILGFPLVIFGLSITFIGIPLALVLSAMFVILLILSKIYTDFLVGNWILPQKLRDSKTRKLLGYLSGVGVIWLIGLIPKVGWIIQLLIFLIALGALGQIFHDIWKKLRTSKLV